MAFTDLFAQGIFDCVRTDCFAGSHEIPLRCCTLGATCGLQLAGPLGSHQERHCLLPAASLQSGHLLLHQVAKTGHSLARVCFISKSIFSPSLSSLSLLLITKTVPPPRVPQFPCPSPPLSSYTPSVYTLLEHCYWQRPPLFVVFCIIIKYCVPSSMTMESHSDKALKVCVQGSKKCAKVGSSHGACHEHSAPLCSCLQSQRPALGQVTKFQLPKDCCL